MTDQDSGVHGIATIEPNPSLIAPPPETKVYDLKEPIISLPGGLAVRAYRHSDASSVSKHATNLKIARNMTNRWPYPYTEDNAHEWITLTRNQENWVAIGPTDPKSNNTAGLGQKLPYAWTITLDDEPIGGMGCNFHKDVFARNVMLGYWLSEEYWSRGFMTRLLAAYLEWFWKTYPWIVKVEADHYGWNPASGKVMMKCGFQYEGTSRCTVEKWGVFGDLVKYGIVREGVQVTGEAPVAPTPKNTSA